MTERHHMPPFWPFAEPKLAWLWRWTRPKPDRSRGCAAASNAEGLRRGPVTLARRRASTETQPLWLRVSPIVPGSWRRTRLRNLEIDVRWSDTCLARDRRQAWRRAQGTRYATDRELRSASDTSIRGASSKRSSPLTSPAPSSSSTAVWPSP